MHTITIKNTLTVTLKLHTVNENATTLQIIIDCDNTQVVVIRLGVWNGWVVPGIVWRF